MSQIVQALLIGMCEIHKLMFKSICFRTSIILEMHLV